MLRSLKLICLCLLLATSAAADVVVSVNVKSLTKQVVAERAYVQFDLINCSLAPTVPDGILDLSRYKQYPPDTITGNVTVTLYRNDNQVSCDGAFTSLTTVSLISNGKVVWTKNYKFQDATADLATYAPFTSNPPSPPGAVTVGPLASRPSPGSVGRLYCTNDASEMRCTRDNGLTWSDTKYSWNWIDAKPSTFPPSAHTHAESEVTNLTSDLASKTPNTRQILPGTGLSGGGNFSADRTLSVQYGSSAGTAAQGNDGRFAAAEQLANKAAANGYASLDATTRVPGAQMPISAAGAFHSINDIGLNTSGSDNSTAISAWASGHPDSTILWAPGTYTISNDLTIPANVTLDFVSGAKLSVGTRAPCAIQLIQRLAPGNTTKIITSAPCAGAALNKYVAIRSTTNFNGKYQISSFTDSQHFDVWDPRAAVGTELSGTVAVSYEVTALGAVRAPETANVFTGDGIVHLRGVREVHWEWYGAKADCVTPVNDWEAVMSSFLGSPGRRHTPIKHGAPNMGGGTATTCDYYFGNSTLWTVDGSGGGIDPGFGGVWSGSVQLRWAATMTEPMMAVSPRTSSFKMDNIELEGQDCFSSSVLSSYTLWPTMTGWGPDAIVLAGGEPHLGDNITLECTKRHGAYLSGESSTFSSGLTQALTGVTVSGGVCTATTSATIGNGIPFVGTRIVITGTSGGSGFDQADATLTNVSGNSVDFACSATGGPATGGTIRTFAQWGASQPDYWRIGGIITNSNHGYGILVAGGDSNGGRNNWADHRGNMMGGARDVSSLGTNSWEFKSELNSRLGLAAGATQALTSVSVSAGTCTATATAALANGVQTLGNWLFIETTTGGTAFNVGPVKSLTVNTGTKQVTYACASSGGPASGGTIRTASSQEVYDYFDTLDSGYVNATPWLVAGPYAGKPGVSSSVSMVWNPYCEFNQLGPKFGGATFVFGGNCRGLNRNWEHLGMSNNGGGTLILDSQGIQLSSHSDVNYYITFSAGKTGDGNFRGFFWNKFDGTEMGANLWRFSKYTTNALAIDNFGATNALPWVIENNGRFFIRAPGASSINLCDGGDAAGTVNIGDSAGAKFKVNCSTGALKTPQYSATNMLISATAPTISSGFGTSPTITVNNGTAAFVLNVGTGGTATSGIIGLPTATNGWNCSTNNITASAAHRAEKTVQIASTTTTATIENQNAATGAALAWTASDLVRVSCSAY